MDLNAYDPAVSQIWSFIFSPLAQTVLNLKSTPIVDIKLPDQTLSTYRSSRELLPTPWLPAIIILNPRSQSLSIRMSALNKLLISNDNKVPKAKKMSKIKAKTLLNISINSHLGISLSKHVIRLEFYKFGKWFLSLSFAFWPFIFYPRVI